MNVLTGFVLYFVLFFVMVALAVVHVLPADVLGGIVVGLFMLGVFYSWLNAWRQTSKLIRVQTQSPENPPASLQKVSKSENHPATEENEPKKEESPIAA